MLRNVNQLEGRAIGATDGPVGKIKDFYFDDQAWVVRYAVVDTHKWFGGHEVLISPYAMGRGDWTGDTLPVSVTKDQVKNSPGVDTHKPISRQFETSYLKYYGYPYYWGGMGLWGEGNYPGALPVGMISPPYQNYAGYLRSPTTEGDAHLRSCKAVTGYHIRADDGEIGHVQGFLVDDATWSIRYLIVNTSNWWMGHLVLVSPEWIDNVNWPESVVSIDLKRSQIQEAPAYADDVSLGRDAESAIYDHYGRHGYWTTPADAEVT